MLTPLSSEELPQGSVPLPFSMGHLPNSMRVARRGKIFTYPSAFVKAKLRFFRGRPGGQGEGVLRELCPYRTCRCAWLGPASWIVYEFREEPWKSLYFLPAPSLLNGRDMQVIEKLIQSCRSFLCQGR